jgi:hypothetical protein
LEYNIIEDLKKTKDNISPYDIFALSQQCYLIIDTFNSNESQKKTVVVMKNTCKVVGEKEESKHGTKSSINAVSIGSHSRS